MYNQETEGSERRAIVPSHFLFSSQSFPHGRDEMRCVRCGGRLDPLPRGRRPKYCSRSCQARAYRARAARRAESSAPPRPALSRARITAAAIRIADTEGLAAMSMRRVAAALRVRVMALYHYVDGKDELIASMVETLFGEGRHPVPDAGDWRAELAAAARWEWALYTAHPWILRVVGTVQPPLTPSVLAHNERATALLVGHGLDVVTAHWAVQGVSGLVQGLGLARVSELEAEALHHWRTETVPAQLAKAGIENFPMHQALGEAVTAAGDLDGMFEFALRRLLDGLAPLLTDRGSSGPPART
jgi:AcrR family transcriptional regulator